MMGQPQMGYGMQQMPIQGFYGGMGQTGMPGTMAPGVPGMGSPTGMYPGMMGMPGMMPQGTMQPGMMGMPGMMPQGTMQPGMMGMPGMMPGAPAMTGMPYQQALPPQVHFTSIFVSTLR